MFESLTERLDQALKKLTGRGKLSEADVDAGLREVRLALLEADVNYKVVKDFVASIRARAVGTEVMDSLNPGQQLVKIVDEEMVHLLGDRVPMLRQGLNRTLKSFLGGRLERDAREFALPPQFRSGKLLGFRGRFGGHDFPSSALL